MKARVSKKEFLKGLSKVSSVVKVRSIALPVLEGVKVNADASKGFVELSMNDTEVFGVVRVSAQIERGGEAAVPASALTKLLSTVDDEVEIESDGADIVIRSGGSRFKLRGFDVNEVPISPNLEIQVPILAWTGAKLKEVVSRVAFAAAEQEPTRPFLEGICFDLNGGQSALVATDGFRLSRQFVSDVITDLTGRYVFPAHPLMRAANVFDNGDNVEIGIGADGKKLIVKTNSRAFVFSMIEYKYPSYESLIPKQAETVVAVFSQELLRACNRVRVVAGDAVVVSLGENEMVLSANDGQDQIETYVEAAIEGERLSLAFDVDYLIDALENLKTDRVTILINGVSSPVGFLRGGDSSFSHVIMPMNLDKVLKR